MVDEGRKISEMEETHRQAVQRLVDSHGGNECDKWKAEKCELQHEQQLKSVSVMFRIVNLPAYTTFGALFISQVEKQAHEYG